MLVFVGQYGFILIILTKENIEFILSDGIG
jgi:hypothetical protein